MREHHVGNVVVVERDKRGSVPVGIVTDRDIVISVIAPKLDPSQLTVGEIMGADLVTASDDQDVFETVEQMRRHGIRRLPITDKQGGLLGIVAVDDLLELLAMQLSGLSRVVARERKQELEARS
jgi:CBS domain-containing protein